MYRSTQKIFPTIFAALMLAVLMLNPANVNACEEEPQSLLSLYLQSDLIIVADYQGHKILKIEDDNEYGHWANVEHNLKIVKILKGQTELENVSFSQYRFTPKPNGEELNDPDVEHYNNRSDYVDIAKLNSGDRHIYFLSNDSEENTYIPTDFTSGVKGLNGKYDIYEKSINELNAIAASENDKIPQLAEWLVKTLEEPLTREDAISDISESFYGLEYSEEIKDATANKTPVKLDASFNMYNSNLAKHFTDTQKFRISGVLYQILQDSWYANKPKYVHYGIGSILKTLGKSRVAVYSFNALKGVDSKDSERVQLIMGFLIDIVGDRELSNIYYKYSRIAYVDKSVKKSAEELKNDENMKIELLKNFDKRFELMMGRNFIPFPEKAKG